MAGADKPKYVVLVKSNGNAAMVKGPFPTERAAQDYATQRNQDPRYVHEYTALYLYKP